MIELSYSLQIYSNIKGIQNAKWEQIEKTTSSEREFG